MGSGADGDFLRTGMLRVGTSGPGLFARPTLMYPSICALRANLRSAAAISFLNSCMRNLRAGPEPATHSMRVSMSMYRRMLIRYSICGKECEWACGLRSSPVKKNAPGGSEAQSSASQYLCDG